MNHSAEIAALIQAKAAKLDTFADHILSGQVVVRLAGKHHEHGNLFEVRIDLTVPGEKIAVTRQPSAHTAVKTLESSPHARVSELFPDDGYGFITTPDGREIYFHRHSVLQEGFDDLQIGTEVSFVEEQGKKGPQASTVKPVGKHHHL
jgi:cold shock CspA family protein